MRATKILGKTVNTETFMVVLCSQFSWWPLRYSELVSIILSQYHNEMFEVLVMVKKHEYLQDNFILF